MDRTRIGKLRNWLSNWPFVRFDALRSRCFGTADGTPVGDALAALPRGAPLFVITTYGRPESCEALIGQLADAARRADVEPTLVMILDGGPSDYAPVRAAIEREFGGRSLCIEATRHLGKHEFWKIHQLAIDLTRVLEPPHVIYLQDDIDLVPGWYEVALSIASTIVDPELTVLSLIVIDDDEADGRWIRFDRQESACTSARLTQWFDLQVFLAMPRFFEALDFRIRPVHPVRWLLSPTKSSGVGRQFTRRLFRCSANVYQVNETLAYHGLEQSLMNPEARKIRSLDNRPRIDTDCDMTDPPGRVRHRSFSRRAS